MMEFARALFQYVGGRSRHFRADSVARQKHDGLFHNSTRNFRVTPPRTPLLLPMTRHGESLRALCPEYRAAARFLTDQPDWSRAGKSRPAPYRSAQNPNRADSFLAHFGRSVSPSPANATG